MLDKEDEDELMELELEEHELLFGFLYLSEENELFESELELVDELLEELLLLELEDESELNELLLSLFVSDGPDLFLYFFRIIFPFPFYYIFLFLLFCKRITFFSP